MDDPDASADSCSGATHSLGPSNALDTAEWRAWLAATDRFGILAVNNLDPAQAPLLIPTHVTLAAAGDELLVHLARPNPVWAHLETATEVRVAVIGDDAYIPTYWRAKAGGPDEDGVPTSYYCAVQFICRPPSSTILMARFSFCLPSSVAFQPEGRHADVAVGEDPYGRMLPGIRGWRLAVVRVEAKFKYDDSNPVEHRQRVAGYLDQRGEGRDRGAAAQQRRRLDEVGDWTTRRKSEVTRTSFGAAGNVPILTPNGGSAANLGHRAATRQVMRGMRCSQTGLDCGGRLDCGG